MTRGDRPERALCAAYRAALRAYPSSFREEYGRDMEETFLDRCRNARLAGRGATLGFLAAAVADGVLNGFHERIELRPGRLRMFCWQDVRYALRLLTRSPWFTLMTIVVLGGGLGLSIFTFSFLHTAMLRPLPFRGGERIVRIDQVRGSSTSGIDAADLAVMRPALRTLTDIGAHTKREFVVGTEGGGERRVLQATAAEWTIFDVTRTRPALGRGFRADDQTPGAEPVIVLSELAWRVVFGTDSAIVDSRIVLNGTPTRVIGVMPKGYGFPVAAEAWVPIAGDMLTSPAPGAYRLDVYGRLAPNATVAQATAELAVVFERARKAHARPGDDATPAHLVVKTFPMAQIGDEGPLVLAVLNVLAGLILLLACVNVTNLLLARANERARETAVRQALGASRSRLVVQSMWESVLLCVAGGAAATLIAAWGLRAINAWAHANLERNLAFWWVWGPDRTTLLAAGAFVTATIAALGGVVAARATSSRFNEVLRDGGARSGARREGRVARALVVTQVAAVSILMFFGVMSGIVAYRVANIDLGYDTRNLLTTSVDLPEDRYGAADARMAFHQALYDGMAERPALDGVLLRAGLADIQNEAGEFELIDGRRLSAAAKPHAFVQSVLGPLATLGITLKDGRVLDARDRRGSVGVVVISQALATRYWPTASPVGQQIRLVGIGEKTEWRTIVGVVSDVTLGIPLSRDRSADAIYIPLAQSDGRRVSIVFRHRGDAVAAQAVLHQAVAAADPLLASDHVATFQEMLEKTALIARSVSKLFAFCFGFALLLAVTGTYGLMARSIGQRTREIGVRRALGASDRSILSLLLGHGSRQLGIGALIALPAMLAVGFGFSQFFPIGLGTTTGIGVFVSATIVAVVLAATYVPTRRALGIPPREALGRE